jgi:hypothetical protein
MGKLCDICPGTWSFDDSIPSSHRPIVVQFLSILATYGTVHTYSTLKKNFFQSCRKWEEIIKGKLLRLVKRIRTLSWYGKEERKIVFGREVKMETGHSSEEREGKKETCLWKRKG